MYIKTVTVRSDFFKSTWYYEDGMTYVGREIREGLLEHVIFHSKDEYSCMVKSRQKNILGRGNNT